MKNGKNDLKENNGEPFYSLAVSYRYSADILRKHGDHQIGLPVRFLYSHSAELFFKAFLQIRGYTGKGALKKKFGHNLGKLLGECNTLGLTLKNQDVASFTNLISFLQAGHSEYEFRYFEESFNTADPNWISEEIGKLALAVKAEVEKERQIFIEKVSQEKRQFYDAPVKILISIGK